MNFKIQITVLFIGMVGLVFSQTSSSGGIVEFSKLTLSESPVVESNRLSITNAEGDFQIQKSFFDYQLTSGVTAGANNSNLFAADPRSSLLNNNELDASNLNLGLGLKKRFRIGLVASFSVDYTRLNDNFPLNRFNQNIGANIDDHSMTSTFSLTQPLLRGSVNVASALEESSILNLESEKTNLTFKNSFELLQTANAYWQYVAANKSLAVFQENQNRVQRVLDITKELVEADKKPAGDLAQIQADLANQARQTKVAEQNLYTAKLNLGRAIGLNEEESKKINTPIDDFPEITTSGYTANLDLNKYILLAQKNRSDIEATKQIEEAVKLQLQFAENGRKPQLDLTGFVNYGGANIGNGINNALATLTQREGRSLGFGVRLNFSFPINNNNARGNYTKSKVALENQQISNQNLKRNIDLNVSIALNNLNNSVLVLEKAEESLSYYKQVFSNEKEKFQNGLTTLLNLILFQERLTFAELEYLQAHQQFASAIVNLRYQTGTLIGESNKNITRDLFYTIPKI